MKKTLNFVILPLAALILLCFFSILMLQITVPYFSFRYDIGFLLTKQAVLHHVWWKYSFYIHIGTSLFVLLFGGLQFFSVLLSKYPSVHRGLGKIYVGLVLGLSAPSGLIMAFYANGGIAARISFVLISVLWWWFTWNAYKAIKRRKVESHIQWMIRSFALTLSAISLRLLVLILPHFIHLHAKEMYTLVSWLSWTINLSMAEVLIKRKNKKKNYWPETS